MVTKPSTLYTIRFSDCDPLGHLNNSRYLDYFLNAREDHLKDAGVDLREWASRGLVFVVTRHEIQYVRAVTYNEVVRIQTALIGYTDHHLDVEFLMFDQEGKGLKAVLWSRFTHIDAATGKKGRLNDEIMEWVRQYLVTDVDMSQGIDARIARLLDKPARDLRVDNG